MQFRTGLSVAAGIAVAALAGCAGGGQPAGSSTVAMPATIHTNARSFVSASGVDLRYASAAVGTARLGLPTAAGANVVKKVFVTDGGTSVQIIKKRGWVNIGSITNGLNGSDGAWVDASGNLYVANYNAGNVTEYAPGGTSPSCTYSGIADPVNVTTDASGNVFVADFNHLNNPGYIDEFAQCSNTMSKQYSVNSGPEGVAVDAKGDIFVAFFNASFNGGFEEFVKGSSTPTPLSATVGSPAGLVIDKSGNLIADDQTGSIALIAPPYASAKTLVSGLSDPFHDSLTKKEALLLNANSGTTTVTVYKYPSGTLLTTLGASNGLKSVEGVAFSPDAVF